MEKGNKKTINLKLASSIFENLINSQNVTILHQPLELIEKTTAKLVRKKFEVRNSPDARVYLYINGYCSGCPAKYCIRVYKRPSNDEQYIGNLL